MCTTLYSELTDAYHRGDGATVGRLLAKVRARARAAERARDAEAELIAPKLEKATAIFPPPPRTLRRTISRPTLSLATSRRLRKHKRLIRDGAIITGIATKVSDGEISYTYRPPFAPIYRGRTIGRATSRFVLGDVVIVFYDARRPVNSVAYEASGFEIVSKATEV